MPAFLHGTTPRSFYIPFENELRHHRFVADFIFCRMEDESQHPSDLVERLLEHQLDVVFWLAPEKSVVPAMRQLLDGGIQLVTISDGKARYPREQYYLDLERGLADGLAEWQATGVNYVAIFGPKNGRGRSLIEIAIRLLNHCRLKHELFELSNLETARQLRRLAGKAGVGVMLQPHHWYESLCDQFPAIMERLFQSCRVMLMQGAVSHGYFQNKRVFADSVTWPHDQMAKRVARDISTGKIAATKPLATFRTCWQPRVDLGKVHRETWPDPSAYT